MLRSCPAPWLAVVPSNWNVLHKQQAGPHLGSFWGTRYTVQVPLIMALADVVEHLSSRPRPETVGATQENETPSLHGLDQRHQGRPLVARVWEAIPAAPSRARSPPHSLLCGALSWFGSSFSALSTVYCCFSPLPFLPSPSLCLISPAWCVAMALFSVGRPFRAFSLHIFLVIGLPHWTTARCLCWFSLPDDVYRSEHVSRDSSSPLIFLNVRRWCPVADLPCFYFWTLIIDVHGISCASVLYRWLSRWLVVLAGYHHHSRAGNAAFSFAQRTRTQSCSMVHDSRDQF